MKPSPPRIWPLPLFALASRVLAFPVFALFAQAYAVDSGCPEGRYRRGSACYPVKDAGEAGPEDEDLLEAGSAEAGSAGGGRGGADAAGQQPGTADAGTSIDSEADAQSTTTMEAGTGTSQDSGSATVDDAAVVSPSCAPACAPKESCRSQGSVASCVCAGDSTKCESDCVDLQSDAMNCGECGYRCETGLSCKQGKCEQKIHELVLGGDRSCALYEAPNGAYPLKCWGDSTSKLFRDNGTDALSPRSVMGVPVARSVALSLHGNSTVGDPTDWQCVTAADRDVVRCWGVCGAQCGNAGASVTNDAFFDTPIQGIASLSSGGQATCALNVVGLAQCWGKGAVLNSATASQLSFAGETYLTALQTGVDHACGLTKDKRAVCRGSNLLEALGGTVPTESTAGAYVRKEVGGDLSDLAEIVTGGLRSCAVTTDGQLWCWGNNSLGSLGSGDRLSHVGAVRVEVDAVAHVAIGTFHTCAQTRQGRVFCWGIATLVGLGNSAQGDAENGTFFTRPQSVPGLDDVVELRAGAHHTCARRRSGQVQCWGENARGQVGDGTAIARLVPTAVIGLY